MSKVLVLDDDEDIASVVCLSLEMEGYESKFITDFRQLETTLQGYHPDVLIMDIFLGDADGRQLCKKLKENETSTHIPVILFSANKDASQDFKTYNAEAFIAKPFEVKDLIGTVQRVIAA